MLNKLYFDAPFE